MKFVNAPVALIVTPYDPMTPCSLLDAYQFFEDHGVSVFRVEECVEHGKKLPSSNVMFSSPLCPSDIPLTATVFLLCPDFPLPSSRSPRVIISPTLSALENGPFKGFRFSHQSACSCLYAQGSWPPYPYTYHFFQLGLLF
jgi:hypothetical protein